MKNLSIMVLVGVLAAFAGLAVTGCKDSKKSEVPDSEGGTAKKPTGGGTGTGKLDDLKAETGAKIFGSVKVGKMPAMEDDDRIAKHTSDGKFCLEGGSIHVKKQTWLVNEDKTVQNVLVFLSPPKGKKFAKNETLQAKKLVMDQPYCNFVAHVLAVQADVTPIVFKNSSKVQHNVKIDINPRFGNSINSTLAPNQDSEEFKFKGKGEMMLDATCSAHGWMAAKIAVLDHPYFAVTDAKGNFEIADAPVGVDLVVNYWHESMGDLSAKKGLAPKSYSKGDNKLEIELP